ncbi:hypothetical protein BDN72DRAFT_573411 [Pluteus cervinus]|uniref:Uncharacterized protein n=1 Tax=Pluteus cervinus TaxID=181527 RepID=A0ACD3AXF3_9AGAR|nr:hypothetical protein BDN72DRAFT_573411 [Pluteus cervinus]
MLIMIITVPQSHLEVGGRGSQLAYINGNGDVTETKRASHKSKSPSSTLAQPSPVYHRPGSYTMEPIVGNGHHPTSDSRDNRSSRRQSIPLPSPSASTDLKHFSPGPVASTSTTLLVLGPVEAHWQVYIQCLVRYWIRLDLNLDMGMVLGVRVVRMRVSSRYCTVGSCCSVWVYAYSKFEFDDREGGGG